MKRILPILGAAALAALASFVFAADPAAPETPAAAADSVRSESAIRLTREAGGMRLTWPAGDGRTGHVVFREEAGAPLIGSIGTAGTDGAVRTIAADLNPVTVLTVGSRDLEKRKGWTIFFDNPPGRPHETVLLKEESRRISLAENGGGGTRATVTTGTVSGGGFSGEMRFTVYRNSPLVLMEAAVSTKEDARAIVYDAGLASARPDWKSQVWRDTAGTIQRSALTPGSVSEPIAVAGRALAVEREGGGALAVFPEPHRFFYPQDEAYNLKFVWHGRNHAGRVAEHGFGIRQSLTGDRRYVPWFNAPPNTVQRLGMFLLVSGGDGAAALDAAARYTHGDKFKPLAGHRTFTSHYHVEHSREFLEKQKEQGTTGVPAGLEEPGFVKTLQARGVDIVHLAEFHFGETPGLSAEQRLPLLKTMHDECRRLSNDKLLVLPGEEPNVHLGGHWISFFPKPVYWILNRPAEKPFVEEVAGYGPVYHVGSPEDVLALMEKENGLMWTAHARIKGSTGFPDYFSGRKFFASDHFLGAAWKAMPADLSEPILGRRVLDLLDDMANSGRRKNVIGEVDTFRMEPDFETYAHMNINYVRLDRLPTFDEGWQPVLDAVRGGRFFVSTGEVLIPDFRVAGRESGDTVENRGAATPLEADLEWTFPMAYAEIVSGDGKSVFRQRVELVDTEQFGTRKLRADLDLSGKTWVRLEAWDIAGNGAFTQPVWLGKPAALPDEIQAATGARFVPERKDDFAWENDLIAFRAYGPAIRPEGREFKPGMEDSGIDVWTKKVRYPVIDKWYAAEIQHGLAYHDDRGEGMDAYSVGSSRGCGGTAIWENGRMILSGPFRSWKVIEQTRERSVFELAYRYETAPGGPVDEVKRITIELGKRLFRSESTFTRGGQPAALDIAIGVTTHEGRARKILRPAGGWMACWESLEGAGLGTGVAMDPGAIVEMRDHAEPGSKEEHALLLTRTDAAGRTVHHAGFAWERAGEITTPEQWGLYLEGFVKRLR